MSRKKPTYEETYAYVLTQKYFDFGELKIGDKPDMISIDAVYGIEAVSALPEDEHREYSCLGKIAKKKKLKKSELEWYRAKRSNYCSYSSRENDESFVAGILEAIQDKRDKVISYTPVQHLGLFINTHLIADPKDYEEQYRKIFMDNHDMFDFIIFEIRNENQLLYVDEYKTQWVDYSVCQEEIARTAYSLFQLLLKQENN